MLVRAGLKDDDPTVDDTPANPSHAALPYLTWTCRIVIITSDNDHTLGAVRLRKHCISLSSRLPL